MVALPTGDLGVSARGEEVSGIVARHFPNTLLLAGLAMVVTIVMALTLGSIAAVRPGSRLDRLISTSATMVFALPEFVVAGFLVLVFALWFRMLPAVTVTSFDGAIAPEMLVLPVLALAVPQIGWNSRIVRGALLDEARAPHVESAIIDGLPTHQVMLRHVRPARCPPLPRERRPRSGCCWVVPSWSRRSSTIRGSARSWPEQWVTATRPWSRPWWRLPGRPSQWCYWHPT